MRREVLADGMAGREQTFVLADGRRMGGLEYGEAGPMILYCHGFPGSRLEARLLAPALSVLPVRLLAVDRPGYGRSDPCPGRTIRTFVADIRQILAARNITECAVLGVSGGGPYALALLHDAPEVTRGAIVSTLGPVALLMEARRALAAPVRAALGLGLRYPGLRLRLARLIVRILQARLRVAPVRYAGGRDRAVLADRRIVSLLTAAQAEGLCQGVAAAAELPLYLAPWGFALTDIDKPVSLWHGGADRIIPIAVARGVARRLPHVRAHYRAADGHYSLPLAHSRTIMRRLLLGE